MSSIKLIAFDLDGVITDTSSLHCDAFIRAVYDTIGVQLTEEQYYSTGARPSSDRLNILIHRGILNGAAVFSRLHDILDTKYAYTQQLADNIQYNDRLYQIFKHLSCKYQLAVVSNAKRWFSTKCLRRLKINKYVSQCLGPGSRKPKAAPDMYLYCMEAHRVEPQETLIVEDSLVGAVAAYRSGAHVYQVNNPQHFRETIVDYVEHCDSAVRRGETVQGCWLHDPKAIH